MKLDIFSRLKKLQKLALIFFFTIAILPNIFSQVSPGKYYQIQAKHSQKFLEVPNSSSANGTVFVQTGHTGKDNQLFSFQEAGGGYYYIIAKHSGKCLDVSGISRERGAKFHQWEKVGGANQMFKLESTGDGYYYITAKHSGKVLDVSGVSQQTGAYFHQWDKTGGNNQRFKFIPKAEGNQPSFLVVERFTIWGDRDINVCWENPSASTSQQKGWVQDVVRDSWSSVTDIDFTGWGTCTSSSKGVRILVKDDANDGPHTKGLGSELNGKQNGMVLNFTLQQWGSGWRTNYGLEEAIKVIAVHEFGHAIGVAHEHNRADCGCWQEPQGTVGDFQVTPCDAQSVMNYCYDDVHTGYLSPLDISGIQQVYGVRTAKPLSGKMAKVTVSNQAGFIARFTLESKLPGFLTSVDQSGDLLIGQSKTFNVPVEALVKIIGEYHTGLKWASLGTAQNLKFSKDNEQKTITAYGTLFNASMSQNSGQLPAVKYEVTIDACHNDLDNTGTKNRITVEFYAGSKRVKGIYRDGVGDGCWGSDASFSHSTSEQITHVMVTTNGSDGYYIDELRMYRNGNLIQHHGRDNGSGWCLSTDPNDANGSWKGRVAGNTCRSSHRFNY